MASVLEELKKLPPEERIKKLKEIEERDKKEIEEASKLIKDSEGEIEHEQKIKEQIPIPQLKAIDISSLFTEDEKQMYATKHYLNSKKSNLELEKTVQDEQKKVEEMNEQERDKFFHKLPTENLYAIRKDIYEQAEQDNLSREQQESIYAIRREFDERREAMEQGTYKPASEAVREILSLSEGVHTRLYRR